jgi:hypothetical protein
MADPTRTELQQRVDSLRRLVYAEPDPSKSALLDDLVDAEKKLAALALTKDEAAAVVLSTKSRPTNLLSAESTGLVAEVRLRMKQIPASVIHLLEAADHPLVEVTVQNAKSSGIRRVRVTTYVEGYSARAIDTVELRPMAAAYVFRQLPTFFPQSLRQIHELTRASVNVLVEDLDSNTGVELQNTRPVWIAPPTTALLSSFDPATGEMRTFYDYLAAFVTPNDPSIMRFLRSGAAAHASGKLVGYQGSPTAGIASQMEAIFRALKNDAGVTYVNSVVAHSAEQGVASQRVRLPRESLADRTANCIDGTVLFASLVEAAAMNPAIVVVPGHAFAAWETWRGSGEWGYLETTMIGSSSFADACASADTLVQKYKDSGLTLCNVRDLRGRGIYPMA